MFNLHRTQTKHLRVTSHLGQLYEGVNDVWTKTAHATIPGGQNSLRYKPKDETECESLQSAMKAAARTRHTGERNS